MYFHLHLLVTLRCKMVCQREPWSPRFGGALICKLSCQLHGAQNLGQWGFLKDVASTKCVISTHKLIVPFAILKPT